MELQRLEQLKDKLQYDEDFAGVWQFFFNHFGQNAAFVQAGQPASPAIVEFIEPVIERTCQHILGKEIMIAQMQLTEVPGHHFYHGPTVTDSGICFILYFDDVKVGMISFTQGLSSGFMHYGRFTTLQVDDPNAVILPTRNQTGH